MGTLILVPVFSPGSSSSRHPNQATPKKSGLKNGQMKNKDDECFGDDIEEIPDTDFDFEGNLALFDKAAVFEEIDTYERRSGARSRGIPNERPARYRHDENILESEPIVYRRITVPHNVSKEFCTGELHQAYIPLAAHPFLLCLKENDLNSESESCSRN